MRRHTNTCEQTRLMDRNSMRDKPRLSLIVPAYNEAPSLEQSIEFIVTVVNQLTKSYEIIIAEDGSVDGTDKIAANLARENTRIIHSHADGRLGKGQALKRALKVSHGEIIVLMDADLATSLSHLSKLVSLIEREYDGAIGSRYSKGSSTHRTLLRTLTSRTYNLLVRLLFGSGIRDHQCGFKAFRRQAFEHILKDLESDGFIFDTELVVKAKKKGFSIVELPVTWTEPYGRTSKFNMLRDPVKMGLNLLRLRAKLWKKDLQHSK